MTNTKKRVKYNFEMKMPAGNFTLNQLEAANSGVKYITLYMRLKKGLREKTITEQGLQFNPTKRGRSEKLFSSVVAAPFPTVKKKAKSAKKKLQVVA